MNKLNNQKQFWFLLSGGKNASFLICWGATQRLPGCNSGSEPALLPFTYFLNILLTGLSCCIIWDFFFKSFYICVRGVYMNQNDP